MNQSKTLQLSACNPSAIVWDGWGLKNTKTGSSLQNWGGGEVKVLSSYSCKVNTYGSILPFFHWKHVNSLLYCVRIYSAPDVTLHNIFIVHPAMFEEEKSEKNFKMTVMRSTYVNHTFMYVHGSLPVYPLPPTPPVWDIKKW
jgi:hypothetical protein